MAAPQYTRPSVTTSVANTSSSTTILIPLPRSFWQFVFYPFFVHPLRISFFFKSTLDVFLIFISSLNPLSSFYPRALLYIVFWPNRFLLVFASPASLSVPVPVPVSVPEPEPVPVSILCSTDVYRLVEEDKFLYSAVSGPRYCLTRFYALLPWQTCSIKHRLNSGKHPAVCYN